MGHGRGALQLTEGRQEDRGRARKRAVPLVPTAPAVPRRWRRTDQLTETQVRLATQSAAWARWRKDVGGLGRHRPQSEQIWPNAGSKGLISTQSGPERDPTGQNGPEPDTVDDPTSAQS